MTSPTTALLAIEDLSIHFGGLAALSRVSLDLHPGEVAGVIGPNGAGKTTLFNAISGVVAGQGKFSIDGQSRNWPKPHELMELGIARTLQGVGLFPDLTVLENVMIGATKFAEGGLIRSALGLDSRQEAQLRERSMIALENLYAAGLANRTVSSLPYPVTKRIAIARALVSNPRILLLDEPAGGLGAQDIEWMIKFIHNISAQCAVLLVEHHMDVVMTVCDRLYVLNFGEVIASGTVDHVRNDPAVISAYLGADA